MLSRVSVWFGALVIAVGAAAEAPVTFTDVTTEWGVRFEHNTGAFGQKYLPETMGSGVAVFDLEGDNDLDILFVNGMDFEGHPTRRPNTAKLYVKSGGAFEDKTRGSGLDVPMYGIGVATGDFDNDGDADVYVSCLGDDRLFRNEGGGKFADVTRQAGIKNPNFGAGVAWFDFDNDGWLDLYVCNYVEWTPQTDIFCTLDGTNKSYCTPESYKGVADILYRNNGNGTFTDVSKKAGVYDPSSKSLGVVAFDYNNDGRIDLFVSNDTEPAKLYDNLGGGKFEEVGMISGVAFNEMGVATAGMGVDAADYDRSGRYSIVVGNFSNEMVTLFKNEGNGLFIDAANETRIGQASLLTLTFGAFFFDADGDGWLDLFLANGHVENEIAKVQSTVSYAQPMHLFQNRKNGKEFVDIAKEAGLSKPIVARGAAYGDLDGDGDLDLVVTLSNGIAKVFRNESIGSNLLRLRLIGDQSNQDAIGATAVVTTRGGKQQGIVRGGGSYASQSEYTLTFGLGHLTEAQSVEIVFPSGRRETLRSVEANQLVEVTEGRGITNRIGLKRAITASAQR